MKPRDPHSYSFRQIEALAGSFRRLRVKELCDVTFEEYLTDPVRYDLAATRLGRKHRTVARVVLNSYPISKN